MTKQEVKDRLHAKLDAVLELADAKVIELIEHFCELVLFKLQGDK